MEPWKIALIGALGAGMIGYGVYANKTPTGDLQPPAPGGTPKPIKYVGTTLPAWPTITQWMNTPAPVSLGALKGKTVLFEVFRTECSHCQAAAPFLVKLHGRYAPRGVVFVGVESPIKSTQPGWPESDWTKVQTWVKGKGYTWPVGFDENSRWFQGKFGNGVYYPSLFLIPPNGVVSYFQSGHDSEKTLSLATELEKAAPGQGDLPARAQDLTRFLAEDLGVQKDKDAQQSLEADIERRLKQTTAASPSTPPKSAALPSAPSPQLR